MFLVALTQQFLHYTVAASVK